MHISGCKGTKTFSISRHPTSVFSLYLIKLYKSTTYIYSLTNIAAQAMAALAKSATFVAAFVISKHNEEYG